VVTQEESFGILHHRQFPIPSFLSSFQAKQNKTKQNKNGFRYASNVPNACCELSFWEIINDDF
jgi:hypothetical protein